MYLYRLKPTLVTFVSSITYKASAQVLFIKFLVYILYIFIYIASWLVSPVRQKSNLTVLREISQEGILLSLFLIKMLLLIYDCNIKARENVEAGSEKS